MKKLLRGIALTAFAVLLCTPAFADPVTYTYTGNPYNEFSGDLSCPPDCALSGWFTVSSPLGDNFNSGVTPTDFFFSDGQLGVIGFSSNLLQTDFYVVTNATGVITQWNIVLIQPDDVFLSTYNFGGGNSEDETYYVGSMASIFGDPGTWTSTGTTPSLLPCSFSGRDCWASVHLSAGFPKSDRYPQRGGCLFFGGQVFAALPCHFPFSFSRFTS